MRKIAFIVPCYNEGDRLDSLAFIDFANSNKSIDFWFVNDGSIDNTEIVLQQLINKISSQLFLHSIKTNNGKASAVRDAFLKISSLQQYHYIGFIDADLSAPLNEITPLVHAMTTNKKLLIVAGCRKSRLGNNIFRKRIRYYLSRILVIFSKQVLKIPNYDPQCGIKLFEANFAELLFRQAFISKWLFDLELFIRAKRVLGIENYLLQIKEIVLNEWSEKPGSKLNNFAFFLAPIELIKIYFKYIN